MVSDPHVFGPNGLIQIEREPRFAIGRHIFDAASEAGVCSNIRQRIGVGDKTKDLRHEMRVWLDIFERSFDLTASYWHFIIEGRGFTGEQYQSKFNISNGYATWKQYNAGIYGHAAIVARNPLKFENGLLVRGTQQIEEWNKLYAEGRGLPYIFHNETQFELSIPCGRICQWASYFHRAGNPRPQCHERSFGRFLGGVGGHFADLYGASHVAGLSFGSFTEQAKLLLASGPEFVGREPKADGGYGENNRERTNDALVVSLKEAVSPLENDRRSRVEGGAVFFIIVVGGLLTVLWLYQAQR